MELREGETIIHKGRPHWIVFGWAIFLALLSARFVLGADLATSREATASSSPPCWPSMLSSRLVWRSSTAGARD